MRTIRYENFPAHILDEKKIPLPGAHAFQLLDGAVLILDKLAADSHQGVAVALQEHSREDVADFSHREPAAGRHALPHGGAVSLVEG